MITGIHHISLKCKTAAEYEQTKHFYTELLGFSVAREWAEGIMIDAGNALIEIFNNGEGVKSVGAIRHIAFATDNVDEIVSIVKSAGYEVFKEPQNIVIPYTSEYPARMAFCYGPLGEEIEFFQERSQHF